MYSAGQNDHTRSNLWNISALRDTPAYKKKEWVFKKAIWATERWLQCRSDHTEVFFTFRTALSFNLFFLSLEQEHTSKAERQITQIQSQPQITLATLAVRLASHVNCSTLWQSLQSHPHCLGLAIRCWSVHEAKL